MIRDPLADKELVLVGTVHRDPHGVRRLLATLRRWGPQVVAVEASPYGLWYRQRYGRRLQRRLRRRARRRARKVALDWRSHGQVRAIWLQLQMPMEFRAAWRYCRDSGARLHLIDSCRWSRMEIQANWPQLLAAANLEILIQGEAAGLEEMVAAEYGLAARMLAAEAPLRDHFCRWLRDETWRQREERLAAGISRLYGEMARGRLVYVGGWQHLLDVPGTLYRRLTRQQPRRVLLHGQAAASGGETAVQRRRSLAPGAAL